MASRVERILILCKTYPSPSAKHAETSCVAGVTAAGKLIRLFPVPFRLISDERQFRKWQWITARVEKAADDHRPESHRLYVDTIECHGAPVSTADNWRDRRKWIDALPVFTDFAEVESARQREQTTLALLRPNRICELERPTARS
jgi:hypothetical protein